MSLFDERKSIVPFPVDLSTELKSLPDIRQIGFAIHEAIDVENSLISPALVASEQLQRMMEAIPSGSNVPRHAAAALPPRETPQ